MKRWMLKKLFFIVAACSGFLSVGQANAVSFNYVPLQFSGQPGTETAILYLQYTAPGAGKVDAYYKPGAGGFREEVNGNTVTFTGTFDLDYTLNNTLTGSALTAFNNNTTFTGSLTYTGSGVQVNTTAGGNIDTIYITTNGTGNFVGNNGLNLNLMGMANTSGVYSWSFIGSNLFENQPWNQTWVMGHGVFGNDAIVFDITAGDFLGSPQGGAPIPEPATMALLGVGLLAGARARKRIA